MPTRDCASNLIEQRPCLRAVAERFGKTGRRAAGLYQARPEIFSSKG
jgi:hypothetical protein